MAAPPLLLQAWPWWFVQRWVYDPRQGNQHPPWAFSWHHQEKRHNFFVRIINCKDMNMELSKSASAIISGVPAWEWSQHKRKMKVDSWGHWSDSWIQPDLKPCEDSIYRNQKFPYFFWAWLSWIAVNMKLEEKKPWWIYLGTLLLVTNTLSIYLRCTMHHAGNQ